MMIQYVKIFSIANEHYETYVAKYMTCMHGNHIVK